jgi:hypothetical protein
MKIKGPVLALFFLATGFAPVVASPLSEQGVRFLLGEPFAEHDSLPGLPDSGTPSNLNLNLNFSQPIGTLTNFFGNLSVASTSDNPIKGLAESSITAFQGGIEWFFTQQQKMQWFLLGGMSGMHVSNGGKADFSPPVISLGLGQNWLLDNKDALRWELRANQPLGNDNYLFNWTPVNFQAIFSYQWGK